VSATSAVHHETSRKPARDSKGIDWDLIHRTVQDSLALFDARIANACPDCQVESLATRTLRFALFSHRAYQASEDSERLIAGVLFEEVDSKIRISGDVSGEESGKVYFDAGEERVRPDADSVLKGARRIASKLAKQASIPIQTSN
jgi:hypothetical protein